MRKSEPFQQSVFDEVVIDELVAPGCKATFTVEAGELLRVVVFRRSSRESRVRVTYSNLK